MAVAVKRQDDNRRKLWQQEDMTRKGSGRGVKKTGGEGEDPMARRKRHCGGKKTGLAGEDVMVARKQEEKRKASWQEQDRRKRGRQHGSKK